MKKLTAALCALMIILSFTLAEAAYSQKDIYNSISSACSWMDKNASPLKNPDSVASDYFIIAMARMNKSYDFDRFARLADSRKQSTYRDGQRIVMSKTACGSKVSDSMVKAYTYDTDSLDNITDLAGAIITLDCGKYEVKDDEKSKDALITKLLAAQHSDGSFSGDCYTTALSIIALSPYIKLNYKSDSNDDAVSYSVESALLNAVQFLGNAKSADFGYSTIRTTAFVIIALDSVGIDADNDVGFADNDNSPLSWLMLTQESQGSFNSSAEDTAFALCALTSHLRAMQGRSPFFSFSEKDALNLNAAKSGSSENRSGSWFGSADIYGNGEEAAENAADADTPDESVSEKPKKSVPNTFATPVPASENPDSGAKHVILVISIIFTTVIFIGVCTYIVIQFKFPELLKGLKKKPRENCNNNDKDM